MQGITRAELDAWGDRFQTSLDKLMTAKLAALPCESHGERFAGLTAKVNESDRNAQDAYTEAQLSKQQASSAHDEAAKAQGDIDAHKTDTEAHGARALHQFGGSVSAWVCGACAVLMVILTLIQIREAKPHEDSYAAPAASAPAHAVRR